MNIQKITSKFSYYLKCDKSLLKRFKSASTTVDDDFNYFILLYQDIKLNKIQFYSFVFCCNYWTIDDIINYQDACDQDFYDLGEKYREF